MPTGWVGRLATYAGLAIIVYLVLAGGTPAGDVVPGLRIVGGLIGGSLIAIYLARAPSGADATDRRLAMALLAFAAAAVLSQFPRQSLDALVAALALVAGLFVARGLMVEPVTARLAVAAMRGMSLALTVATVVVWLPRVVTWLTLTGGTLPPLGMTNPGLVWGHRYDLTLLLALLYPSWWVGSNRSRLTMAVAAIVGALTVPIFVLGGSRTLWVAAIGATAVIATPLMRRRLSTRTGLVLALAVLGVAILVLVGPGPGQVLRDRLLGTGTLSARADMWSLLVSLWVDHPIGGLGPGSFPWALQQTAYFDTNSWAPRHPDSLIFQTLPELGLLGIGALLAIVWALAPPILRSPSPATRWALAVFALAGVGTNPAEFTYLLAVAVVWVALAAPRSPASAAPHTRPGRVYRFGAVALFGCAGAAWLILNLAALNYADGRDAARHGDWAEAEARLDTAIALDPGMALYRRQRGAVRLIAGGPEAAIRDLDEATRMNPWDDVAWRSLALAHSQSGDLVAARFAADEATRVQRSDPANLLLAASLRGDAGVADTALLGEVVQAWPAVVGASGWSALAGEDVDAIEMLTRGLERWEDGRPSPEPDVGQRLWLAATLGRPVNGDEMDQATAAVLRCTPDATRRLAEVPLAPRRVAAYWALVVRQSAVDGRTDERAIRLHDLVSSTSIDLAIAAETLNPLDESGWAGFSADVWGYRRQPIEWPDAPITLPSPQAGAVRWIVDPRSAIAEARLESSLADCVADPAR
jgi:tetratricopeptide (TPR) repeat protein